MRVVGGWRAEACSQLGNGAGGEEVGVRWVVENGDVGCRVWALLWAEDGIGMYDANEHAQLCTVWCCGANVRLGGLTLPLWLPQLRCYVWLNPKPQRPRANG